MISIFTRVCNIARMSDLVIQAIETLYSPNVDPQSREKANSYLDNWQHSIEAWSCCLDVLLKDSSSSITYQSRLFLVQTLRRKITNELSQLSIDTHKKLRDNILSLIQTYAQSSLSSHTIVVQLCLCLSQLSIHMNQDEWPTPIHDICCLLAGMPSSLKEFLILFPEEARDSLESASCSKRSEELLSDNIEHVFTYMRPDLLKCISSNDSESLYQVLCCFQRWTRSMGPIHQHILEHYTPHLISLIITAFKVDPIESSDNASELASEMIYNAYRFHWNRVIDLFFSNASAFISILQETIKQSTDDDVQNVVKSLAYLLVDLLNDSIPNLLQQTTLTKDTLILLEGILLLVQYPDFKIIEITFRLVQTLSDAFREQEYKQKSNSYHISLLPIGIWLSTYVAHLTEQMKHPHTKQEWTSQKYDDFRSFRHIIGDVLKDCSDILGIDHILKFISDKIENHLMAYIDKNSWTHFEGYLSTLRMLSSCVSDQESVYIPRIMNHLSTIYTIQQNIDQHLTYSCILFISSYASWTRYHLDTLERQVELIQKSSSSSKSIFSGAMLSLRNLCKYATQSMTKYGDWMLKMYQEYETIESSHDMDMLFQCIALLVSKMPNDSLSRSLSDDLLKKLDYHIHHINDNGKLCIDVLNRYSILIEVMDNNNALTSSFIQNIPLLSTIYFNVILPRDDNILEALGRVERHAFQYFKDALISHLDTIALMLLEGFYKTGSPSILYTVRSFVKQYAHQSTKDSKYTILFNNLLKHINDHCAKLDSHVMEDWFNLLTTVLEYIPEVILEQNTLMLLIQVTSRYFVSKDSHDPIIVSLLLTFWNDIYHVLLDDNQPNNVKQQIESIVEHIPNLTYIMIKEACSGSIPPTALTEVSQLVRTFGRINSTQMINCFQTYLNSYIPTDKMTFIEKESFIKNITEAIKEGKNLSKNIRQLSRLSRQRGI